MKHEFEPGKYFLYRSFKFKPIVALNGILLLLLILFLYRHTIPIWHVILLGLVIVFWAVTIYLNLIKLYIVKRSTVFVKSGRVIYRQYKIMHGRRGVYFIDYHIKSVANMKWRRDYAIFVNGDITVCYILKDEDTVYHKTFANRVVILPVFADMQGIWNTIEECLDSNDARQDDMDVV